MSKNDWVPLRSVRIPDERWKPALTNTHRNGTTVTAVINEALENYNKKHEGVPASQEAAVERIIRNRRKESEHD